MIEGEMELRRGARLEVACPKCSEAARRVVNRVDDKLVWCCDSCDIRWPVACPACGGIADPVRRGLARCVSCGQEIAENEGFLELGDKDPTWEPAGRFRVRRERVISDRGSFRDSAATENRLEVEWREPSKRSVVIDATIYVGILAAAISALLYFPMSVRVGALIALMVLLFAIDPLKRDKGPMEARLEVGDEVVIHREGRRRALPKTRVEGLEVRGHHDHTQLVLRSGTRSIVVFEGDMEDVRQLERELAQELEL